MAQNINMFEEDELPENECDQDSELVYGWRYEANPAPPPTEAAVFGEEDHYDDQYWQCPVCEVEVGECHAEECSYPDGE